jgi:hypothetical protein
MRKKLLPALVALPLLAGCQTWGPTWSEVTGARYANGTINEYRRPAVIERVDDQGAFVSNPIKIEPGPRRLVLGAPTPGWPGGNDLKVYMLDAAPCKRYYINAQFKNNVEIDWEPVLDYAEDIVGCKIVAKQ